MNSKKLLIVDDSSIFVSRLKRLLQVIPGLDPIREAGTNRDALSELTTPPLPDILLLDMEG
jgi:CheY-like chemotaxis protein